METKLTLLGKSDGTIAIIMDILESNNYFPNIDIVNNLFLPITLTFDHPKFNYNLIKGIKNNEGVFSLGVTNPSVKKAVLENFNITELSFINLIHSTSNIASTASIGKGFIIGALSVINAHTKVGDFVSVNRGVTIGHHTIIGNFVTINPGCNIAGNITIGNNTAIGIGTNILDGVNIGENCVIGAGSVVTKDIPNNVVAYGVPCKIIRKNEI